MMAALQSREACVSGCKRLMAIVEIYTTPMCPYCVRAKRLLSSKGVVFTEIDLWQFPARRDGDDCACARAANRAAGVRGRAGAGRIGRSHRP